MNFECGEYNAYFSGKGVFDKIIAERRCENEK